MDHLSMLESPSVYIILGGAGLSRHPGKSNQPGAVDTEGARAIGAMSDEVRAAYTARTPLGRVGTPADIASVAVFLASDEAGWLTGECLAVSGGLRSCFSSIESDG